MGMLDKMFGSYSDREVKRIIPIINEIDKLGAEMEKLSDQQLKDNWRSCSSSRKNCRDENRRR